MNDGYTFIVVENDETDKKKGVGGTRKATAILYYENFMVKNKRRSKTSCLRARPSQFREIENDCSSRFENDRSEFSQHSRDKDFPYLSLEIFERKKVGEKGTGHRIGNH